MVLIRNVFLILVVVVAFHYSSNCQSVEWIKSDNAGTSSVIMDDLENIYSSGFFFNSIDMDPGSGVSILESKDGSGSYYIRKLNKEGDFVWARIIGDSNWLIWLEPISLITPKKNLVTCGNYFIDPLDGIMNVFIQKSDSNGSLLWIKRMWGKEYFDITSTTVDSKGNILILGNFEGSIDTDLNSGLHQIISKGQNDLFLVKP